jgi:hypothetical protein
MYRMSATALALLACVAGAEAARPIQKRSSATVVVTGKVLAVYSRSDKNYNSYIVEIQIETVHKGEKLRPRDLVQVYVYQRKPGVKASLEADTAGHKRVPREGARVKAYALPGYGKRLEGVYPDWVDVLPSRPKK